MSPSAMCVCGTLLKATKPDIYGSKYGRLAEKMASHESFCEQVDDSEAWVFKHD